jgi:hypothetical protein
LTNEIVCATICVYTYTEEREGAAPAYPLCGGGRLFIHCRQYQKRANAILYQTYDKKKQDPPFTVTIHNLSAEPPHPSGGGGYLWGLHPNAPLWGLRHTPLKL